MKKIRHGYLAAAFLVVAVILLSDAEAGDIGGIVSRLQEKYGNISSIEADFTQEAYSRATKKAQTSEGKVYFKKPGKMRWQYLKPVNDEIVSNGKTIWIYQPDLGQVLERPFEGTASNLATDFLSGVGNLKKNFDITLQSETGAAYRLSLVPKEPQQNIRKVSIEADKSTFIIKKTVVEDNFGNETRVGLKNIKIDAPLKDSLFEFVPPKGAAVIKP
ncbi:MAG: outer membrane lipoprotein chaperone LolA [Deltaproteobacteria bacterium]|nr:outer membrane lipoprotein chaperone LolA [Deltaproteobacteria bacterium]